MNEKDIDWTQSKSAFTVWNKSILGKDILLDSSKSLLQQSDATKGAIVKLLEEYENKMV